MRSDNGALGLGKFWVWLMHFYIPLESNKRDFENAVFVFLMCSYAP